VEGEKVFQRFGVQRVHFRQRGGHAFDFGQRHGAVEVDDGVVAVAEQAVVELQLAEAASRELRQADLMTASAIRRRGR
jgi:hypothetical protein